VGLIQHLDLAVQQHLNEGTLVRVLQPWCKPFPGFYLYLPSREQMPSKVRALLDFLIGKREAMSSTQIGKRPGKPGADRRPRGKK